MAAMAIPRVVKERATGVIWAGAWMWPLIPPLIASLRGQVSHAVWAGVGLVTFMVLYLIVVTNAFDEDRRQRRGSLPRLDVVLLLVLAALGITLFIAYRDEPSGWWNIMLYVAVVGAALLPLLRERVTAAGGALTTGNASHGGFRVFVTMPATATPPCAAGPVPSMWAVRDHAERSDRDAAQPAMAAVPAVVPARSGVDRASDADGPDAAVDSGTGSAAPPVAAPNVPAQPTSAAGSMVVGVQGKSS
jgi:hypothetical protein